MRLMTKACLLALALSIALFVHGCQNPKEGNVSGANANSNANADTTLAAKIRRFAPTEVTADVSHLSDGDRKALDDLIQAAKLMDSIFYRQVWSGNDALKQKLESDQSPAGQESPHYFVNKQRAWARRENNKA